jgi:hypothetical protein
MTEFHLGLSSLDYRSLASANNTNCAKAIIDLTLQEKYYGLKCHFREYH